MTLENALLSAAAILSGVVAFTVGDPAPEEVPERPPFYVAPAPVASSSSTSSTTTTTSSSVAIVTEEAVRVSPPDDPGPVDPWPFSTFGYYGPGSECPPETADLVAVTMRARGASDRSIDRLLSIMSRESRCEIDAYNDNPQTRDDSVSLCQINRRAGWFDEGSLLADVDPEELLVDLVLAVESCSRIWELCGFGPWTPPYSCTTPEELR